MHTVTRAQMHKVVWAALLVGIGAVLIAANASTLMPLPEGAAFLAIWGWAVLVVAIASVLPEAQWLAPIRLFTAGILLGAGIVCLVLGTINTLLLVSFTLAPVAGLLSTGLRRGEASAAAPTKLEPAHRARSYN